MIVFIAFNFDDVLLATEKDDFTDFPVKQMADKDDVIPYGLFYVGY